VHGGELAEHVAIADLEARRLALVLEVLRRIADRGELEDLVGRADGGRSVDDRVRPDPGAGADAYTVADHRERTHRDIRREFGTGRNDCAGIDTAHVACAFGEVLLVSGATIISADVTSSSPTYATVENFQMPRIWRSRCAVRISWSPGATGLRKRALSIPTKKKRVNSSGTTSAVMNASRPDVCASASMMMTPGMTGRCGKCPGKNGSLTVTFL